MRVGGAYNPFDLVCVFVLYAIFGAILGGVFSLIPQLRMRVGTRIGVVSMIVGGIAVGAAHVEMWTGILVGACAVMFGAVAALAIRHRWVHVILALMIIGIGVVSLESGLKRSGKDGSEVEWSIHRWWTGPLEITLFS